jgi:hypothetical protein
MSLPTSITTIAVPDSTLDQIVELPRKISRHGTTESTTRTFRGTKSDILSLATQLETQGYILDIEEGPTYSMTATIGSSLLDASSTTRRTGEITITDEIINWEKEPINGNWSVGYKESPKDILESSYIPVVVYIRDREPSILSAIEEWAKSPKTDTRPAYPAGCNSSLSETEFNIVIKKAEKLCLMILNGLKTTSVQSMVAKLQINLPKKFSNLFNDYFLKHNTIISMSDMASEKNMEDWVLTVIQEMYDKETIGQEENDVTSSDDEDVNLTQVTIGKHFGFLKKTNMDASSNNTVAITVEYEFGLWSEEIYGLPSGAVP